MRPVVALYVRSNSVYFDLAASAFDARRDARRYVGSLPVVAHPPCRAWGRLSHLAKPRADEAALGLHAVDCVRRWGGVLEHPVGSRLWDAAELPKRGRDAFGGWTLPIWQSWWGHRAPKATWLYIVGVEPCDVPDMPFDLAVPVGRVELMGQPERERTPVELARWLCDLAGRARP